MGIIDELKTFADGKFVVPVYPNTLPAFPHDYHKDTLYLDEFLQKCKDMEIGAVALSAINTHKTLGWCDENDIKLTPLPFVVYRDTVDSCDWYYTHFTDKDSALLFNLKWEGN